MRTKEYLSLHNINDGNRTNRRSEVIASEQNGVPTFI